MTIYHSLNDKEVNLENIKLISEISKINKVANSRCVYLN